MTVSNNGISIDICVCTFRRPFLVETLKSIGNLVAGGPTIRVIVADNDFVPSAQPVVELIGRDFPFSVIYVHAPAANISLARNACLDSADADFIAFVDDDETVSRDWLVALLDAANSGPADVVLGPVRAQYDESAPAWMPAGDFHSTAPVRVGGAILTGYTCNVLIRWQGAARTLRFDPALGRSGGEDTDFFYRLHDLGARFTEAPSALVFEPVPPSRANLSWLLRRRFRSGQTHGMRLRRTARSTIVTSSGLALAKVGYCLIMTVASAASSVGWRRNLLRAALHIGVLGGLTGSRQAILYGDPGVETRGAAPTPTATAIN